MSPSPEDHKRPFSTDSNRPKHDAVHNDPINKPRSPIPILKSTPKDELHDLICVGFGPASLAIAVALHDALVPNLRDHKYGRLPRVRFLESQEQFGWHAGMQLPGAQMQISFLKDLATVRDPRSDFTFLNYLHCHDRLVPFSNLGTFLPSRKEFEDYMKWCAGSFTDVVEYGQSVVEIVPNGPRSWEPTVDSFTVVTRDVREGTLQKRRARHVVLAMGGQPNIPEPFPQQNTRVIHTSGYRYRVSEVLPETERAYNIVVVGGGQSAAETFHDLHSRYPNAKTSLVIRDSALRPSDDSPFVNEIFDPSRVDHFYEQHPNRRSHALASDKATNYSVVRLELLERIYKDMYNQRIDSADPRNWQHRILPSSEVRHVEDLGSYGDGPEGLRLLIHDLEKSTDHSLDVDAVIVATGYTRTAHESMLRPVESLRAKDHSPKDSKAKEKEKEEDSAGGWKVHRNYRLNLDPEKVRGNAGIWLQGCNEETHGLSDTLLSILATRGGEMVRSIFGYGSGSGGTGGD